LNRVWFNENPNQIKSGSIQFGGRSYLSEAVQGSFQVQIKPFSRQWIRDNQYYVPTTVTIWFKL